MGLIFFGFLTVSLSWSPNAQYVERYLCFRFSFYFSLYSINFGRARYWSAAYAVVESVCLSVRPSVRLSICLFVGESCLKGSRIEALSAPYNRGIFLVSLVQIPLLQYSLSPLTSALERGTPLSRGKIGPIIHRISQMAQDRYSYYYSHV